MPKNPFVNCKSRKRRKPRVVVNKPDPKLFCPRTMVRFDGSPNGYHTMWFCKMCKTCLLSESSVLKHIEKCKEVTHIPVPVKNDEDVRYICDICNRVFSRKVTLNKHKEEHEKSNLGLEESEEEFDYITDSPKKKKEESVSLITPELESMNEIITDDGLKHHNITDDADLKHHNLTDDTDLKHHNIADDADDVTNTTTNIE